MSDNAGSLTETTLSSEVMYRGRILNLRVDTVQLPSGRIAAREVAEHSDSICVVPIDDDGNVVMVRQFRTPTGGPLLELPAGGVEPGEISGETVQRELQEEIGHRAGGIQRLAGFWLAPGWCDEFMHAYLATGLTPSKLPGDDDENIVVERVSFNQALEFIADGTISDAKSIAGLLLAMRVLGDN